MSYGLALHYKLRGWKALKPLLLKQVKTTTTTKPWYNLRRKIEIQQPTQCCGQDQLPPDLEKVMHSLLHLGWTTVVITNGADRTQNMGLRRPDRVSLFTVHVKGKLFTKSWGRESPLIRSKLQPHMEQKQNLLHDSLSEMPHLSNMVR